jgi:hypothetical protein
MAVGINSGGAMRIVVHRGLVEFANYLQTSGAWIFVDSP